MKKIVSMLLAICMVFAFAACGESDNAKTTTTAAKSTAAADSTIVASDSTTESEKNVVDPIVLKLGSQTSDSSLEAEMLKRFKANVEEQTNGEIQIDLYLSSALGKLTDMIEGVSMGSIDFVTAGLSSFQSYCKNIACFDQFSLTGPEDFVAVYESEPGQTILEQLRNEAGIRVMAYTICGVGTSSYWANQPYETLADLKGVNIRSNGNKTTNMAIEALGAVAVTSSNAEQFNAYQTGLVDMMSLDASNMISYGYITDGMYRVSILDNFIGSTISISEKTFEKLTTEQQEIVLSCAKEAFQDYGGSLYEGKVSKAEATLKEMGVLENTMSEEVRKECNQLVADALYEYKCGICDKDLLDAVLAVLEESHK